MAVYTKTSKEEIEQHLENYQLGKLVNFKEIVEGIDNSNFILDTEKGRFILTIFESRISEDDLPFFINFKMHLAKKGICCPRPIEDKKGEVITDLKGKKSVIVTFLSGAMLESRDDGYYDNITSVHCFEMGKVLAKLHVAAKDFPMSRPNELGISGWKIFLSKFEYLIADYKKDLGAEINEDLEFLKNNWRFDLESGATHLDLFPDNVFFDENAKLSGVIDFYFAANDSLIYDLAIIVNAWCFDEKNNFIQERFDEMLRGYESIRKISTEERDFLKVALVGAAMRFLLTRLHDMFFTPEGSLVKVKNPKEYLEKLRFFKGQK